MAADVRAYLWNDPSKSGKPRPRRVGISDALYMEEDQQYRDMKKTFWEWSKAYHDIEKARDVQKARDMQKACGMQTERVGAIEALKSWWTQTKEGSDDAYNASLTLGLLRNGLDPSVRTLRAAYMKGYNDRKDARIAKEKAREMDAGDTQTDTWTGNLRHAYSSMHARRSRRVAPSQTQILIDL